MSYRNFSKWTC